MADFWGPPPGFKSAFEDLRKRLNGAVRTDKRQAGSGVDARKVAFRLLGTTPERWSPFHQGKASGNARITKSATVANDIISALRGGGPRSSRHYPLETFPTVGALWEEERFAAERWNLANMLARKVCEEGNLPWNPHFPPAELLPETVSSPSEEDRFQPTSLGDKSPKAEPATHFDRTFSRPNAQGKSTGTRENWVSDLCYVEAEWRDTNLAPGEGQWLQLQLKLSKSYTRDRTRKIHLDVEVHRIHVNLDLDGGRANCREPWIERANASDDTLEIFQGNDWSDERPSFEVDNPVRNSPLSGNFGWFDLCEVTSTVGAQAIVELSASIGGITIALPEDIKAQLDPDKLHDHDFQEERLIEGWLRHRLLPKSRLLGGGLFQLTQIALKRYN